MSVRFLFICIVYYFFIPTSNSQLEINLKEYTPINSSITSCRIVQNSIPSNSKLNYNTPSDREVEMFRASWQSSYHAIENELANWNTFYSVVGGTLKILKDGSINLVGSNPIGKLNLMTPFLKSFANRVGEAAIDWGIDKLKEIEKKDFETSLERQLDDLLFSRKKNGAPLLNNINNIKIALRTKVKLDNYPIFNKAMLKAAFIYIDSNKNKILKQARLVNDIKLRTGGFEKGVKSLSGDVIKNIKDIKKNKDAIIQLEKKLQNLFNSEIEKLQKSFAQLGENQLKNLEEIFNISNLVKGNSEKIKKLENELKDVNSSFSKFDEKLKEHNALITENKYYIDVISTYTFKSLSLGDKIESLKNRDFHWMKKMDKNDIDKEVSRLERIKMSQDFIQVANIVNNTVTTLEEVGLLEDKDAQRVGKFMQILNAGASIGAAYATFSPTTICNAIFSTLSIFGKRKMGPSPEMKMLQKIYKTMNKRFDEISHKIGILGEQVGVLSKKLDYLIDLNIQLHDNIIEAIEISNEANRLRFNNIDLNLKKIQEGVNNIIDRVRSGNKGIKILLQADMKQCQTFQSVIYTTDSQLTSYESLDKYLKNTGSCKKCLESIQTIINKRGIGPFLLELTSREEDDAYFYKAYKPTVDIYKSVYLSRNIDIINASTSIQIPKINQQSQILKEIFNHKDSVAFPSVNFDTDKLISPYELGVFIEWYLNLYLPYRDFLDFSNLTLMTLNKYLNQKKEDKVIRINEAQEELKILLEHIDNAIIQQSIFSGHNLIDKIYKIVYDGKYPKQLKNAIKVLENNPLIRNNFAKYILYKNFHVGLKNDKLDRYTEIIENLNNPSSSVTNIDSKNSIQALNQLPIDKPIKFDYQNHKKVSIKIELIDKDARNTKFIYLQAPSRSEIVNCKMNYSRALHYLTALRKQLITAYKDISIMKEIGKSEKVDKLNTISKNLLLQGVN